MNKSNFDFTGAKVLITAGTSGIGLGTAHAFRDAGANVRITGTRGSASEYDEDLHGFRYDQLDVTDNQSVDALASSVEELDILVHSAGIALVSIGLDEYEPDNFDTAVRMHLTSVYRLSRGCLGPLTRSDLVGGASIVGIASMTSYFAVETTPGYGAGKAGLVQLMKTMSLAWAKHGIRANAVAAGVTLSRQMKLALERSPDKRDQFLSRMALQRLGEPEDIAAPILFLCSQQASFITGQTLPVDGGYSIVG